MDKENEWEHTKPTTPKLTKTYGLGFWNSEIISICCLIDFQSFLYGHYETLDTSTGSCTMVGDLIGSSRIPEIEKPTSYWYWFRFNWLYSHLLFSHYLYTEDFSTHQLWRWNGKTSVWKINRYYALIVLMQWNFPSIIF